MIYFPTSSPHLRFSFHDFWCYINLYVCVYFLWMQTMNFVMRFYPRTYCCNFRWHCDDTVGDQCAAAATHSDIHGTRQVRGRRRAFVGRNWAHQKGLVVFLHSAHKHTSLIAVFRSPWIGQLSHLSWKIIDYSFSMTRSSVYTNGEISCCTLSFIVSS